MREVDFLQTPLENDLVRMILVLCSFKTFFMKKAIHQEILLMVNSSLSKRSLCERNNPENNKPLSNVERLEQACWNGMLDDFLPELVMHFGGRTLFMWEIQTAKNFLHIDLCDQVTSSNKELSIDPYIFLNHLSYN
jgi:hypothetical protein